MLVKDNKFGYKVCYQRENEQPKRHIVTNSYRLAKWEIERYEKSPPYDKQHNLLDNVKWYILPVKNYLEYSILWRGCPFRDYLSDFIKRSKNK